MKTNFFFLLVLLCVVSGCSNNEDNTDSDDGRGGKGEWLDETTGNYMDVFIQPDSLGLTFKKGDRCYPSMILTDFSDVVTRGCNGKAYYYNADTIYMRYAKYKEYAKYYNDTTYYHAHTMECSARGCLMPLNGIIITADRDMDEHHPAGATLNDLFKLSYSRFYQYIQSGYKPEIWMNAYSLDSVSELSTFKGAYLFSEKAKLIFKKEPSPGKYTFTVAFNFGEDPLTGEKVTVPPASIEIEF